MFNGMNGLEILNSWPRFESGELVWFGDEYVNAKGNVSTLRTIVIKDCRDRLGGGYYWKLGKGACAVVVKNGERIKRPPVLAADGKQLEVGQTVYVIENGKTHHVTEVDVVSKRFRSMEQIDGSPWLDPMCFTHQRPVLDADGVPIKKGDEVYLTDEAWVLSEVPSVKGEPLVVTNFKYNRECPVCAIDQFDIENGITVPMRLKPGWLTHTKPEPPDSWEKWREDFIKPSCVYCRDILGVEFDDDTELDKAFDAQVQDMERRARALAERERSE